MAKRDKSVDAALRAHRASGGAQTEIRQPVPSLETLRAHRERLLSQLEQDRATERTLPRNDPRKWKIWDHREASSRELVLLDAQIARLSGLTAKLPRLAATMAHTERELSREGMTPLVRDLPPPPARK